MMTDKNKNTLQVNELASDALTKLHKLTGLNKKIITEVVFVWISSQSDEAARTIIHLMQGPDPKLIPQMKAILVEYLCTKQKKAV
ncbi:MAG: hypothetical protein FWD61_18440 [Phycisphaerales bacterium]|nr:hypothetical protein [Phycisphaerales bacterium]